MNHEELYAEIDTTLSVTQKYFGLSLTKFFLLFFLVVGLGVYLGVLFYGTSSLEILIGLQDYEIYLQTEVLRLKLENAELQHEFFELKEISAQ
jgi:hypothetical protein